MRQTEIKISSEHGDMDAYWEEHWSDSVLIYIRFIYL